VLPEATVPLEDLRHLFEQLHREQQQVVEIDGAAGGQALLIARVDGRDLLLARPARGALHVRYAQHLVLGVTDAMHDGAGRRLVAQLVIAHELPDERLAVILVVDREVSLVAEMVDVRAEDAHAGGMEGGHDGRAHTDGREQGFHAARHLLRRLVGEGDGDQVTRVDATYAEHVGDAVRDDARLAAAGAGKDEERTFGGEHGLALGGVQVVQEMLEVG
jgi:hypothetical protein